MTSMCDVNRAIWSMATAAARPPCKQHVDSVVLERAIPVPGGEHDVLQRDVPADVHTAWRRAATTASVTWVAASAWASAKRAPRRARRSTRHRPDKAVLSSAFSKILTFLIVFIAGAIAIIALVTYCCYKRRKAKQRHNGTFRARCYTCMATVCGAILTMMIQLDGV